MRRATPPSSQPEERQRIKDLQIQIPGHTERNKEVSIRSGQMSQVLWEAAPSQCELTQALCLYFVHLKPSFAASFTSNENKKREKEGEKKNKTTPTDYRGNGNVPVFTVASIILIKPKVLLRSFSNKYSSIILIFSEVKRKEKDKRNKQNSKYYLLSQQSSMV